MIINNKNYIFFLMKQFIYFSKYKSEANISKSFNLRMCRRSSYICYIVLFKR